MNRVWNRRSIAFRLVVAVLAVEALFALLIVFLAFGYERHVQFDAFHTMIHGRADSVMGAIQDSEDAQDTLIMSRQDLHLPLRDVWEALDMDGRVLGRSDNWDETLIHAGKQGRDGFLRTELHHRGYAVLMLRGTRLVDPDAPGGGTLHNLVVYYGAPTGPIWHAIHGAVDYYAAGSLLLLLVTGPLIAWLLHRGLAPMRELASLAAQVSANSWEFSPPATARSTPELTPLTAAIENVLARLQKAFEQQRVFVSDAAHELKTAVAVIKSSLQLLALKPRTVPEYEEGLNRSLADTERMESLVGQMLTLARVESADAAASESTCELISCAEDVREHLQPAAELRQVRVAMTPTDGSATVRLTPEDCFILVSNLVFNAIQHSPSGATVEIGAGTGEGSAWLTVRDHGEGLAADVLPHAFERFYRGDPSRARATGGSGLGLAIAKGIVERAGGSITIENCADGGAKATVRLPRPE
ncbi:MAG TPA: ATP-binding protein [Terracidiphilus sp.]|nr:ATP-binding protein [Terracidiphilus sp.]